MFRLVCKILDIDGGPLGYHGQGCKDYAKNTESLFSWSESEIREIDEEIRKENLNESIECIVILFEMVYRIGLISYFNYDRHLSGTDGHRGLDDYAESYADLNRF
ncbi:MAG: hypothetical protein HC840_16865 [Leptolyngbyaceae cyanobacterium RM2_2_4]|nr:hypothetical protein [Leptolyngbyaceae cyanobacterium RM2_2_4]